MFLLLLILLAFYAGPAFVAFQLIGGAIAVLLIRTLYPDVSTAADEVILPHAIEEPARAPR